jgi:hypothetical protein
MWNWLKHCKVTQNTQKLKGIFFPPSFFCSTRKLFIAKDKNVLTNKKHKSNSRDIRIGMLQINKFCTMIGAGAKNKNGEKI